MARPGKVIATIADLRREKEARFQMLERLADYDEHLMEELLGDIEPPREEMFSATSPANLAKRWWCRCWIGSAMAEGNGVRAAA